MRQRHISTRLPLLATALFLAALAAHGQAIPEGGVLGIRAPVLDPPPGTYEQFDPHVAAAPDGGWAVFWASLYNGDGGGHLRSRLTTRRVSPAGLVGELRVIDETDSIDGPIGPSRGRTWPS